MEEKTKELLNTLRILNDSELLMALKMIYEDGYVDGYNGNNIEKEFKNWLEEWNKIILRSQ